MFKITSLHAFLSVGDDGEEGVVAAMLNGRMMPLISADETRFNQLRPIAEQIAKQNKMKIVVAKFTVRENVETIGAGPSVN